MVVTKQAADRERNMRKRLAVFVALVILTIPALQSSAAAQNQPPFAGLTGDFEAFDPPREMPPIDFVNGDGVRLGVADFAGKIVVLNLWATWCAPCVREMPALDRLQAARGGPDLEVVAVSFDRKGVPVVDQFFTRRKIDHLAIYVDKFVKTFRAIKLKALPTTYILGRDGRALGVLAGPAEWDSPEALALIDHYLGAGS
jgi:thiol-disulfide isomerase/thioredoxin